MPDNRYNPELISVYDDVTSPSSGSVRERVAEPTVARESGRDEATGSRAADESRAGSKRRLKDFLSDRRWRVALGVIMILAAAYLFISTISYFFSGEADQSELDGVTLEQLVATSGEEIQNVGGPAGALVSHRLVTHGLGLGVIPIFIYLVLLGVALLGIRKCNFWSITFKGLLLAVTISIVLGFVFYSSDSIIPPGGYHGHYMNYLIMQRFSWIGALCVSLALVGCVVGVYFYDILKVWNRYRAIVEERRERRRKEEEERARLLQDTDSHLNETYAEPIDPAEPLPGRRANDMTDDALLAALNGMERENQALTTQPVAEPQRQAEETPTEAASAETAYTPEPTREEIPAREIEKDTEPTAPRVEEAGKGDEEPEPQAGDEAEAEVEAGEILTIKEGAKIEKAREVDNSKYDPTAQLSNYRMPGVELLKNRPTKTDNVDISEIEDKKNQITEALSKYGIGISKIEATVGPTVTMYEIVPAEGVKIATIKRLEEDIAMALAALSTRIIAPIPGKSAIGIEVPNKEPQMVSIRTIFESKAFNECDYELPIALGTTIDNQVYIADLAKMPHLLVAGATGKGKSVGMNVIINSLLFKKHPAELKFVLVDPKMVEFYPYRKLEKHYLAKVEEAEEAIITDTSKVVDTLKSLCIEMDERYKLLQKAEVVKITHYNELFVNKKLNPEKGHRYLPYIVVIVDEYADLVMTAGKEVETPIARLAQKARAVGMHVIIATQRPSANIITGIIKGNFPARIAFKVSGGVDSKIILDTSGAQQLIGNGDMLISQDSEIKRVQCAFISTDEIKNVAQHIFEQTGFGSPLILPDPPSTGDKDGGSGGGDLGDEDILLEEVARAVVTSGVASTSNVQRRYQIGYNRAGRIMDQLQALGVVGPAQGSKPREILVDSYRLEEILQNRHG